MTFDDQIANLKKIGALKDAVRDEDAIRQYLSNARQYRDDASKAASPAGRFTLAYEALFALAMAVLTDRGVRTGGEGHRSTALQLTIVELTKDAFKGTAQAVGRIHAARNDSTYFKPVPPVSDALAKVTLKLMDAALAGATVTIRLNDAGPSRHADD